MSVLRAAFLRSRVDGNKHLEEADMVERFGSAQLGLVV